MSFEWLLLLLLPSLGVRALALNERSIMGWVCGLASDVFVHTQLLILCLPLMKVAWLPALIYFALQLDILFDAFLYRNTAMRMEVAFFAFFDDIRHFWDSAKEKEIHKFLPFPIILLLYSFALFHLSSISTPFWPLFTLFAISGAMSFLGLVFLKKKMAYAIENVVFQQQVYFIKKAIAFFKKSKQQKVLDENLFLPSGETFSKVSPDYPLLKWTEAFSGPKQCEVDIDAGEKPHVIFLFMESFRAKDIGVLGGKYGVSPHFDQIAQEGILFTNFYANSVKTSRSAVSSLFGIPSDVDSSEASSNSDLPLIGLPDILARHGYHTAYLHNGPVQFENQLEFFLSHGFKEVIGKKRARQRVSGCADNELGVAR